MMNANAKKTTTGKGIATARHTSATTYDVSYIGQSECDADVPHSYLQKLAKDGWRVVIEASQFGPRTIVAAE